MAENRGTHRARDEAHCINREGLERPHRGIRIREEQLRENEAGDGAVEKEIVPLDRGADGGRNDCAAQLRLVFGRGKLNDSDVERGHGALLPPAATPDRKQHGVMMKKQFCDRTPEQSDSSGRSARP